MMKVIGSTVALALLLAAGPAAADVKAGVDAWSRGDFSHAVAEWRPAAIQGDADAQFNLGQAYKLGRGVPVDPAQALDWFKRAADQGHVQAQDNYALGLYQANRRADALPWLERSVARGEPRCQLVLGTMLFNGDGVKTDYPRAYALMTRASQSGLVSASQSLAQMDGFITAADRERGLQLAQTYAAQVKAIPADATPPVTPAKTPPIQTATIDPVRPAPAPRPLPVVASHPAAVAVTAKPAPARTGNWRIQLGAFRDRSNAETLWNRVRGRLAGAQPAYVPSGGVTRLQATGFATKAEAQRACTAAAGPCVIVAP